jgi:acetylornithine/succinyldiaminopimelate/putrescine aminotransferase
MLTQRELFLKHLAQTSPSPLTLEIERAEGVYLFTPDGRKIFDLISGVSVSSIGHSNPKVVEAVCEQAHKYMHLMVYGEYVQYPQVELAKRISELLPPSLQSVYFVNSGSEAVEGAVKLAKRFTGRYEAISFKNAYHGSTHGALSLMGNEEPKQAYRPLLPAIHHLPFNCINELSRITTSTACVIIEPVQGEAGIVEANPEFMTALREKCNSTGTLLIFDEIQTGMGRTGTLFAFERYKVIPDILLVAKAFGGGMPLGAFISSNTIMQCLTNNPPLGHITTFGGHPVSCAAAIAALDVIKEENLIGGVKAKELLFRKLLEGHPQIRSIRSSGLFMAVELDSFDKIQRILNLGIELGFVTDWFLFCNNAFRIAPPLIISEEEIKKVCSIIVEALDQL